MSDSDNPIIYEHRTGASGVWGRFDPSNLSHPHGEQIVALVRLRPPGAPIDVFDQHGNCHSFRRRHMGDDEVATDAVVAIRVWIHAHRNGYFPEAGLEWLDDRLSDLNLIERDELTGAARG